MQEVTKTLIEQLETDWNLSESLHKQKITFRRGEPPDLATRFVPNSVSIEALKFTTPIVKRTSARSRFNEIISLNMWMIIEPKTQDAINDLLDERQKIVDEIRRIVKLRQRTMTNIRFSYLTTERYMDEYEAEPPVLRMNVLILCTYCA